MKLSISSSYQRSSLSPTFITLIPTFIIIPAKAEPGLGVETPSSVLLFGQVVRAPAARKLRPFYLGKLSGASKTESLAEGQDRYPELRPISKRSNPPTRTALEGRANRLLSQRLQRFTINGVLSHGEIDG
jgi:hypothetical protein